MSALSPADVVAALPVLAQVGGAVAQAVESLLAAVAEERPELLGPLPGDLPEVADARAAAINRADLLVKLLGAPVTASELTDRERSAVEQSFYAGEVAFVHASGLPEPLVRLTTPRGMVAAQRAADERAKGVAT